MWVLMGCVVLLHESLPESVVDSNGENNYLAQLQQDFSCWSLIWSLSVLMNTPIRYFSPQLDSSTIIQK